MKIAYITAQIPYGKGETFIIPEIKEVLKQGHEVVIMPFRPLDNIFHKDAESLRDITHHAKIFALRVLGVSFIEFFRQPLKCTRIIGKVLFKSRSLKIALKNLTTIPKGFYAARVFRNHKVEHIHAHWASTPSSAAYIASELSGISWSFTAHRWDIVENNLLKEKIKSAICARAISEAGKREITDIINDSQLSEKVVLIHMGVSIPAERNFNRKNGGIFTIICPANIILVKGHRYLIEACRLAADAGIMFKCLIAGDGPLEDKLKDHVASLKLANYVEFLGRVPHDRLMEMYQDDVVDLVVLPSIVTEDGEKEGIPVSLMEAMAHGIPVVSTNTGGIPELIDGAGILIPEKDPYSLADAIKKLLNNPSLYAELQESGRKKILEEFNLSLTVSSLLDKIKGKQ